MHTWVVKIISLQVVVLMYILFHCWCPQGVPPVPPKPSPRRTATPSPPIPPKGIKVSQTSGTTTLGPPKYVYVYAILCSI